MPLTFMTISLTPGRGGQFYDSMGTSPDHRARIFKASDDACLNGCALCGTTVDPAKAQKERSIDPLAIVWCKVCEDVHVVCHPCGKALDGYLGDNEEWIGVCPATLDQSARALYVLRREDD